MSRVAPGVTRAVWLALLLALPALINPLGAVAVEPLKAAILRCLALIIATGYVLSWSLGCAPRPRLDSVKAGAIALVAATALSVAGSGDPALSLFGTFDREMGLVTLVAGVCLLIVGSELLADPAIRTRSVVALVLGAVAPCAYALVQVLGRDPISWTGVVGIVSTTGSPTFLGGYLVLVGPFALWLLVRAGQNAVRDTCPWSSIRYAGWLATYGLIVIVLLLANVRGPLLGFVAGTAVCAGMLVRVLAPGRSLVAVVVVGALALTVLGAALTTTVGLPLLHRFLDVQDASTNAAESVVERLVLWRSAALVPVASPLRLLIGFGPEMQQAAFERVPAVIQLSPDEQFDRAHNLFVDSWLTGGVLGLGFLLATIAAAVGSTWRAYCQAQQQRTRLLAAAVAGALAGHLVEQSFAFQTVLTGTWFWVVLAFGSSLARSPRVWAAAPARSDGRGVVRATPLLALLALPALAAPAIADTLYGAALRAERDADQVEAAQLAERAAWWAPWVEELPTYAGTTWHQAAAHADASLVAQREERATSDLELAAQRASWDPYAYLRLARQDAAWAMRAASPPEAERLAAHAAEACGRADALSPYRRAITDGCADVARIASTLTATPGRPRSYNGPGG